MIRMRLDSKKSVLSRLHARQTGAILAFLLMFPVLAAAVHFGRRKSYFSPQMEAVLAEMWSHLSGDHADPDAIYTEIVTIDERIAAATRWSGGVRPKELVVPNHFVGPAWSDPGNLNPSKPTKKILLQLEPGDAFVLGVPIAQKSLVTSNRWSVFTECAIRIKKVLADTTHLLHPGQVLVISRGGGEVYVDGVRVRFVDPSTPAFQTGKPYYLTLWQPGPRFPAWGWDAHHSYKIDHGIVSQLSSFDEYRFPPVPKKKFLADIRTAIALWQ